MGSSSQVSNTSSPLLRATLHVQALRLCIGHELLPPATVGPDLVCMYTPTCVVTRYPRSTGPGSAFIPCPAPSRSDKLNLVPFRSSPLVPGLGLCTYVHAAPHDACAVAKLGPGIWRESTEN